MAATVFNHKENLCLLAALWGLCDERQRNILTVGVSYVLMIVIDDV